jgi:hypothetical protein
LLEKLRAKHVYENEDAFFSDFKKLEAYLTMQFEMQSHDLGKTMD